MPRPHEKPGEQAESWTESVIGLPTDPADPSEFVVAGNLVALERWNRTHRGQAALVLGDPPYNARNIKDYHDDLAHDAWIGDVARSLESSLPLLRPDGILAMHIDDSEHAYLQVLLDRMLGRARRLNTVVVKMSELAGVKMRYSTRMLPRLKEYVLLYGAGPESVLRPVRRRKEGPALDRYLKYYAQFLDNPGDAVESWRIVPLKDAARERGIPPTAQALRDFQLANPGQVVYRTNNRWFDSLAPEARPAGTFAKLRSPWDVEYVWWEGRQMLFLADHLEEPLGDLWTDISTINVQREGGVPLRSSKKPEALVLRLIELCTRPGDLVVDPWSGSGTTASVATKSGRRWLACERDPVIAARALDRLSRVVEGRDETGVSAACAWTGGGGFRQIVPLSQGGGQQAIGGIDPGT